MKKIVISGAGLVGSFLAYALAKRGHSVELYEKRSDMRKGAPESGRSINLVATSRALNAFKENGILDEVLEITTPVTGRMMHSKNAELTYQPYGRDESECNYSVSRSLLNCLLMDIAERSGVKIFFESELDFVDYEGRCAKFSTTEVNFDHFIGADGAGSKTREALTKQVPDAIQQSDFIDSDYKELFMPATEMGEYPIEKKALHIWPRGDHMLMALPNLDGSFTMTVYLPISGTNGFDKLKTQEDVAHFFNKEYADSVALMPNLMEDFFDNPQGRLGTVKSSHWVYKDRVALVGDAAHAIVPFFGQGMNCGMEDCSILLKLLDDGLSWNDAFEKYENIQKPNANAIATMALENFIEMRDKVGDEKFLLKKKIEHAIENKFPEHYRSRYGMVTYTLIPYADAFEAGLIQDEILDELAQKYPSANSVDLNEAWNLIEEKFSPFIKKKNLDLKRFII